MLSLFPETVSRKMDEVKVDLHSYEKYIVYFSGGKDSLACLLYLLEEGIDKSRIELWHHKVDGEGEAFMDWKITQSYCQAVADHFQIPLYSSWKQGGFYRELMRENSRTAPTCFEDENKIVHTAGGERGKLSTRRKFPQVSPDLSVRWCSAYLKIDVATIAITNQKRFHNSRTLTISGERGEESSARAKYKIIEPDRADNRNGKSGRLIDRHRPLINWKEKQVWNIIEKYSIRPHPAYYLGFGRTSCLFCIFGGSDQYKSAAMIAPEGAKKIIALEKEFGVTIKRNEPLSEVITKGTPYEQLNDTELLAIARGATYTLNLVMDTWKLPAGAYKKGVCGPQ